MQPPSSFPRLLDPAAVKQRIDSHQPIVLVEALPEPYYQQKHLPGAINVPHDVSDEVLAKLLPHKEAETIVYCASGPCRNSALLARRLVHSGYLDVSDFETGKAGWEEAGYEFDKP